MLLLEVEQTRTFLKLCRAYFKPSVVYTLLYIIAKQWESNYIKSSRFPQ